MAPDGFAIPAGTVKSFVDDAVAGKLAPQTQQQEQQPSDDPLEQLFSG